MTAPILTGYGIGHLPEPCWTIVMVDDTEFDPTGMLDPGHYETQLKAEAALPGFADDDRPAVFMKVTTEDFRCLTLVLICGDEFIDQGGDEEYAHFVDTQELRASMKTAGIVDLGENRFAQPDCCTTCTTAIAAAGPTDDGPHLDQIPAFPTPEEII
jgi:hypothetical protein